MTFTQYIFYIALISTLLYAYSNCKWNLFTNKIQQIRRMSVRENRCFCWLILTCKRPRHELQRPLCACCLTGSGDWYPWWRHQMGAFSALLALCAGNSPVTGEFPSQRPVTRSFDVFSDLRLNKRWVNNRDAGDWRRNRVHYDVTVMFMFIVVPF